MNLAIIPYPVRLEEREGNAGFCTKVEEEIVPSFLEEQYTLSITPDGICIKGGSKKALLYGNTTLEQIRMQSKDCMPCLYIEDWPAYPFRAFLLDSARHFIEVDELKKMIRMAAFFKLNQFHWHITEDQGYRVESLAFPRLHEVGSVRKGDHFGHYGRSDLEEGAYYTREQVKEIVAYCASLGIEVVPELDMPGHVTSILAAYPHLGCLGGGYEVGTQAGVYSNLFCVGKEETFDFIKKLIDEFLELFPGTYFHIGGDEVPKVRWKHCPACQRRMREEGIADLASLQIYAENRIIEYVCSHGRIPIVWNDAAGGGNLDKRAVIQLWMGDQGGSAAKHIQNGGKVMLSKRENTYCDFPYGMFSFQDMYNLETKPAELAEAVDEAQGRGEMPVIGNECLVWTEYIKDVKTLESFAWPRFTAGAEIGWNQGKRAAYADFLARVRVLFPVFEQFGIQAMEEAGWDPAEEERIRQKAAFDLNYKPEYVRDDWGLEV